jgi:hypothetical protein
MSGECKEEWAIDLGRQQAARRGDEGLTAMGYPMFFYDELRLGQRDCFPISSVRLSAVDEDLSPQLTARYYCKVQWKSA